MAQASSAKTVLSLGQLIVDRVFPSPAADEHADIDGTYTYKVPDMVGGYIPYAGNVPDLGTLLSGAYMCNFSSTKDDKKKVGFVSWTGLTILNALPSDIPNTILTGQENITISFGLENNSQTYHGSSLNKSLGGVYEKGKEYIYCVSGCNGEEAIVTIKADDENTRTIVFKSVHK